MDKSGDNTKVCATDIKIGARLSIAGLVKMAIDFTMSKVNKEAGSDERHGFASATGNCGASSTTGNYTGSGTFCKKRCTTFSILSKNPPQK